MQEHVVHTYFVCILTNSSNTVLYTGVSGNLYQRMIQHKMEVYKGFTARDNVNKLVYFEQFTDPSPAITREKQIKAGSRLKKIQLIESMNPEWKDLSEPSM